MCMIETNIKENYMLQPIGDRVLVKPVDPADSSTGGILYSVEADEDQDRGVVVSRGDGKNVARFKKGDILIIQKYGPARIKFDGKNYAIVHFEEIYGVQK